MPLLRLQNKTPENYVNQSRDFQLFCRLYDSLLNGTKNDIDSMVDILDAKTCRSSMLPLLQTKLGFYTNKKIGDEALRLILSAFPKLVKHKGSLDAIKGAVNVYLKILHISTEFSVVIDNAPRCSWVATYPEGAYTQDGTETIGSVSYKKWEKTVNNTTYTLYSVGASTTVYFKQDDEAYALSLYTISSGTVTCNTDIVYSTSASIVTPEDANIPMAVGRIAKTIGGDVWECKAVNESMQYGVRIYIRSSVQDTSILDEILKYILPTGYTVSYHFYVTLSNSGTDVRVADEAVQMYVNQLINNLRGYPTDTEYGIASGTAQYRTFGGVDTTLLYSPQLATPMLELSGFTLRTVKVSGVTKYMVYQNDVYVGYVNENNEWHSVT